MSSLESIAGSTPATTVSVTPLFAGSNKQNKGLDVNELCTRIRLGQRTHRRRSSSASSASPPPRGNQKGTASTDRKIVIVGRFATPKTSPRGTPALSAYNSGAESSDDDDDAMECDADDEADVEMERRGRNRNSRALTISST